MQTLWQQNYDPAGNIWLSALVALIPIVFFFLALTKLRLKGYERGQPDVPGRVVVLLPEGLHNEDKDIETQTGAQGPWLSSPQWTRRPGGVVS